ncbi:ribonuclease D [Erythrobacter sp. SD-21]|uniref:ribonuclease D n=1 Tax=Erythrobacter sp. SD-21 TaxID=161528 RepID=UPI000153F76C|nr:3'-5' exonuclease [Erythrobacter sp. SD-21]EDL49636.1 ribonuclease D 3'-5' exonuclease [Erythrobacter sp. SD-21]
MAVHFHEEDLPEDVLADGPVAVDTETMGLVTIRDRLCVVQISDGNGDEHLVRFGPDSDYDAPNLKAVLGDPERLKLFHFARFDLAAIEYYLGVTAAPCYCTKIASKMVRTFTDRHGLKNLVEELLGESMSKAQQSSDWGGPVLNDAQRDYAASDVRFLHRMKEELDRRLEREGRTELAQACFDFLPARAHLDILGWDDHDIFSHASA